MSEVERVVTATDLRDKRKHMIVVRHVVQLVPVPMERTEEGKKTVVQCTRVELTNGEHVVVNTPVDVAAGALFGNPDQPALWVPDR